MKSDAGGGSSADGGSDENGTEEREKVGAGFAVSPAEISDPPCTFESVISGIRRIPRTGSGEAAAL